MQPAELFTKAVHQFDLRVKQIRGDQWQLPTPCTEWDVRALVKHLVYELLWLPPLLDGKTIAEVGDQFEGDTLGSDPKASWDRARQEAIEAVQKQLVEIVHLSGGDTKTSHYLMEVFADLLIHSWDLARAIGADEQLDPKLVRICYQNLAPKAKQLKASGLYGGEIKVAKNSDLQIKLLALVGRQI